VWTPALTERWQRDGWRPVVGVWTAAQTAQFLRQAVRYDTTTLTLYADTTHPLADHPITVVAELTGYRAVPPAWTIAGPNGSFPTGGQIPGRRRLDLPFQPGNLRTVEPSNLPRTRWPAP
jgi:hypothetical protein